MTVQEFKNICEDFGFDYQYQGGIVNGYHFKDSEDSGPSGYITVSNLMSIKPENFLIMYFVLIHQQ